MGISEPAAGISAQLVQRQKSNSKLRFGRDKIFRKASGSEHAPASLLSKTDSSASSNSLATEVSSSTSDGEEEMTWRIEAHGNDKSRGAISSATSSRLQAAAHDEPRRDGLTCRSLADLEILATIGISAIPFSLGVHISRAGCRSLTILVNLEGIQRGCMHVKVHAPAWRALDCAAVICMMHKIAGRNLRCAACSEEFCAPFAGRGTFGRVKLARALSDGRHYAIKVLRKEQLLRLKQVQHVLNERRLLAAIDHPLIVKM